MRRLLRDMLVPWPSMMFGVRARILWDRMTAEFWKAKAATYRAELEFLRKRVRAQRVRLRELEERA